jgi:hypothetical protein
MDDSSLHVYIHTKKLCNMNEWLQMKKTIEMFCMEILPAEDK